MLPRSATTITALALGVVMAAAGPVGAADRDHPVVIELFQSQGWTPQVVVNGRIDTVGTRRGEIEQVIAKADRGLGGPAVSAAGGRVTLNGAARTSPAEVWLVRYDPGIIQVPIRRGENGGKTLPHRNVVRELVKLGDWSGARRDYVLPRAGQANLKSAILVQQGRGGAIIAAARL